MHTGLGARRIKVAFILVAWLLFLILAIRAVGPDSAYSDFNSDSAIPVLMANDNRPITVFDTYYYGADRWGGWPMLIAKQLHLKTGLRWTDQRLHYFRTAWVFIGLLVLVCLNRRDGPAVLIGGLIALFLESNVRRRFFDLSQLYAWQLTALFFAWLCLRQLFAQRNQRVKGILWATAFYFSSLFAIWSSVVSAPLLFVLVTLEALRFRFSLHKSITKRRIGLAVALLLAATASELLLKMNYHRYGLKHVGNDYKTPMAVDVGYLGANLFRFCRNVYEFSFFPWIAVAVFFVIAITVLIIYALVTQKRDIWTSVLEDETTTMIVALMAMATVNLLIVASIDHVRLSGYDNRFLTPTYIFAVMSGVLAIYLSIRVLANRIGVARYVLPLVLAGAFIWLSVGFPRREVGERYKMEQEIALTLSRRIPKGVLMGGYWETYIFAGLQPTDTMTPLPLEGKHVRIPWTYELLDVSSQAVIEYQHSEFVPKGSLPPQETWQYGNLLKLQDAHFYENGPYAFALYSKDPIKPQSRGVRF